MLFLFFGCIYFSCFDNIGFSENNQGDMMDDVQKDIEEIVELGNRMEVQMERLNKMIECQQLRDHIDILFAGVMANLNDIRSLKEMVK